ncbi:hypothetical protein LBMAG53_22380 [Planctomycetota bacterium]|nr:hypothetical protein LBMAG53_22380 [Planctomycetota bacterium]
MIGQVRRLARHASALLLVTGLISILAVIAAVFLLRTREDADAAQPLLREAQARLMLSAACLYVLETSRLGWGEPGHGWIDNRNGSIGPRPPRNDLGQIPQPTWWKIGSYPKDDSEDVPASIPPKVPWNDYGYTQTDPAGGDDTKRIDSWPHPGGVCRSEMARWVIPPYATTAHYTMNPVQVTSDFMPDSAANLSMGVSPPGYHQYGAAQNAIHDIRDAALQRAPFFLQPQPVADSHGDQTSPVSGSDFVSGRRITNGAPITSPLSPAPVFAPASMNRGWFRVYRELPSEHDGVPTMVGTLSEPYFDTIAISEPHPTVAGKYLRSSDAVFVITCGAGATAGFRTWNEVVHCGATQRFGSDRLLFNRLRGQERILWYRVCWTSSQGGGYSMFQDIAFAIGKNSASDPGNLGQFPADTVSWDKTRGGVNKHAFGVFTWIQRLPSEPPRW